MAVKIDLAKKRVALGVGDLVAEALIGAGRVAGVSLWARMEMGREAHQQHQQAQADQFEGYARELFVRWTTSVDDFAVTIQGRIDGVQPPAPGGPAVIEEIKSVIASPLMFAALDADSYPHHAEQLRLYCFLAERGGADAVPAGKRAKGKRPRRSKDSDAKSDEPIANVVYEADGGAAVPPGVREARPGWGGVIGRLIFVNVADGLRKEVPVPGPFDDCARLIEERVRVLIGQAIAIRQQRDQRRDRAPELVFPHSAPRKYQDEMLAAVERALAAGRHLLVSAPSGIGKTAAALYPAVKHALGSGRRVFFVTAKNTQHQNAEESLRHMQVPTAVVFRAREKMCINSVYACREEFCPHLQQMAAKLLRSGVSERLWAQRLMTPETLMDAGRVSSLCPFELALLEAERVDVIVGDYNYVFDPQVYFRRFFQDEDYSDAVLIIDEAHNLVQRAMDYYSPCLRRRQVRELAANLGHVEPSLARDFRKTLGVLDGWFDSVTHARGDEYCQDEERAVGDQEKFLITSPREWFEDLKPAFNKLAVRYLLDKIDRGTAIPDDPVEQFLGDFGQFCSVLAMDGEEFAHIFDTTGGGAVKILCKDPSRPLARRLEGFHSVIAMSATLAPMEFYREMLVRRGTDRPGQFPIAVSS